MLNDFLTAGAAADRIGATPKDVSDAIYRRRVDVSRCPVVAGRRLIPTDLLPELRKAIKAAVLPTATTQVHGATA